MPIAPLRACPIPGCPELTASDRCTAHAEQRAHELDTARLSSTERGYGHRWREYSKARLKTHPLCVDPDKRHPGKLVLATVTDHIQAHKGDMKLFWDKTNHESLCGSCNSFKAVREGRWGRGGSNPQR
jgi:5-methylcytosine-specific restriction enzyme A